GGWRRWRRPWGARRYGEWAEWWAGALGAGRRLARSTIDSEITFASAADRAAFADDLAGAVSSLAARYHTEGARGGRRHRLVVALHPSLTTINRKDAP